jgi:hypothetical protein
MRLETAKAAPSMSEDIFRQNTVEAEWRLKELCKYATLS